MTMTFLSLGSNIDREQNIGAALQILKQQFGNVEVSPVYESEAVGFEGDHFLNLVVKLETHLPLKEFSQRLKTIEDQLGRNRKSARFASRTMDIDIVLFGDLLGRVDDIELPRPELYYNAFVLKPFVDLAPDFIDPKSGQTMASVLDNLPHGQRLWKVDFTY